MKEEMNTKLKPTIFFVDFKVTYDIDQEELYKPLKNLNIPNSLIGLVKFTMRGVICTLQVSGQKSSLKKKTLPRQCTTMPLV